MCKPLRRNSSAISGTYHRTGGDEERHVAVLNHDGGVVGDHRQRRVVVLQLALLQGAVGREREEQVSTKLERKLHGCAAQQIQNQRKAYKSAGADDNYFTIEGSM